jgi:hypothetical protein
LRLGQRVLDVCPQLTPWLPFRLRQLGQGGLAAYAGEVGVFEPVLQLLRHGGAGLVRFLVQQPAPGLQLGPQPSPGLLAEAAALLVVQLARIVALAAAGQRREASGVVAMAPSQVVRQLRLAGEGFLKNRAPATCNFLRMQSSANSMRSAAPAGTLSPRRVADSRPSTSRMRSQFWTQRAEGYRQKGFFEPIS